MHMYNETSRAKESKSKPKIEANTHARAPRVKSTYSTNNREGRDKINLLLLLQSFYFA